MTTGKLLATAGLLLALVSLSVFPAEAQKLLKAIALGGQPFFVAANTATSTLYVSNITTNGIDIIDAKTNKIITEIPAGEGLGFLAVNPATNRVYASTANSILVIDGSSNQVIDTINASSGWMAVNSSTNRIYFNSGNDCEISVIDGSTDRIVASIPNVIPNATILGIAVNPDTNRIYLAGGFMAPVALAVINGNNNQVISVFTPSGLCFVQGLSLDATLNRVYVSDSVCGSFYILNGKSNQVAKTLALGYSGVITVNETSHLVGDMNGNVLTFIDGRSGNIVGGQVAFPLVPAPVGISSNGNTYYVIFHGNDNLAVASGPK